MRQRTVSHRVYKAVHRPLTIAGVDRRMFFLALLMGAATFNLFYSFVAGLITFAMLYVGAWWSSTYDPLMLQILLASAGCRSRYDAAKHGRFDVEMRAC
jgi:type IV secretory pathway VirB3-like protein